MSINKAALAVIAAVLVLGGGAMTAAAGDHRSRGSSANALTGSWSVTVDRSPLPVLKSLQSYDRGGAVIETANTVGNRGPSHGAWTYLGERLYATTIVFFRFDPQGAFIGTQQVNSTLRLAGDGDSWTAISISELRDAAGNVVAANLRATATATRIVVERIPDTP